MAPQNSILYPWPPFNVPWPPGGPLGPRLGTPGLESPILTQAKRATNRNNVGRKCPPRGKNPRGEKPGGNKGVETSGGERPYHHFRHPNNLPAMMNSRSTCFLNLTCQLFLVVVVASSHSILILYCWDHIKCVPEFLGPHLF